MANIKYISLVISLFGVSLAYSYDLGNSEVDYKLCLRSHTDKKGSLCFPEQKPKACSDFAWKKIKFNDKDLPYCNEKAQIATTARLLDHWVPSGAWLSDINQNPDISTKEKIKEAADYLLKKRCDLKGSLSTDQYSIKTVKPWCASAGMYLMHKYFKTNKSLAFKDLTFYIDGHKVLNAEG